MSSESVSIDLTHIQNLQEVEEMYDKLCQDEVNIGTELENLLSQHVHLEAKIISFKKMLPNLQLVETDSDQLSGMISFTSSLAENISSKVKKLDLTKNRVAECLQRVDDIRDLKSCTDGVQTSLHNEDYEQLLSFGMGCQLHVLKAENDRDAAAHIHRFLSLDQSVLRRSAADVTEGSSLDEAFAQLHQAEDKLKTIVMQKFDEAVRDEDIASVERFFKIFPLLNQHSEGLKKFSTYLCSQIAETAHKNLKVARNTSSSDKRANVIYADTVTLLFEGIARVVEIHQPLVETYYGPGKLLTVIEMLQKECDRQVKKVIEEFKSDRQLTTKVNTVQQLMKQPYKFTDRLDPRQLDVLLGEMTLLNTRAELYIRFIRRRVTGDIEVAFQDEKMKQDLLKQLNKIIKECELSRAMQELLGHYIMMEEYFLRESVNKAISMDVIEENALTSSMLDDVFFILRKCVRRSLTSSSIDGICAMLNHSCTLLDSTFCDALNEKLRQGFPSGALDLTQAYNVLQSSLQQGRLQSSDSEKSRATFLTTLNNAEVAGDYTVTLIKNLEEEIEKTLSPVTEQETAKLQSCLSDLNSVTNKFRGLVDLGVGQLCSSSLKPRIKTWIDAFQSTNHIIDEDDFSQYDASDGLRPFMQTFMLNIDSVLKSLKLSLTPNSYDGLVTLAVSDLTTLLEKTVLKCAFNRLGGLQFDKELRSLISYLTTVTTWTIRDKFARLMQIATVLNLEKASEILDFWGPNSGSMTWRLAPSEVRQVLRLRMDFKDDDIRRIKL